jgi:hypothetical protein
MLDMRRRPQQELALSSFDAMPRRLIGCAARDEDRARANDHHRRAAMVGLSSF